MKPFKKIATAALAASVAGTALTAAGSAYAFGGPAFGDGGKGFATMQGGKHRGGRAMMREMFERLDTDGDGTITAQEVEAVRASHFSDADTDGNGEVSLGEFKAAFAEFSTPMKVRAFQFLDRDGNGEVTTDEYNQVTDRGFARLDRNDDGVIEPLRRGGGQGRGQAGERGQGKGQGQGQGQGQGMGQGDGERQRFGRNSEDGERGPRGEGRGEGRRFEDGDRGSRGGRGGPGNPVRMLMTTFDQDGDGKVSREEFETVRAELFASADASGTGAFNQDGFTAVWLTVNDANVVRMFQREDADGSLALTAEEHGGPLNGFIDRHDRNDDGVVTKADFRSGKRGWWGRGGDGNRGGRN